MLLDGHYRCRGVLQLNAEGGHAWTEHPLGIALVIRCDSQAIGQANTMNLSKMSNTSTVVVHIDRVLLYLMEAVLNNSGRSFCNSASHFQRHVSTVSSMIWFRRDIFPRSRARRMPGTEVLVA